MSAHCRDGVGSSPRPILCGHPLTGVGRFPNLAGGPAGPATRDPPLLPTCITMHRRSPAKLPDPSGKLALTLDEDGRTGTRVGYVGILRARGHRSTRQVIALWPGTMALGA